MKLIPLRSNTMSDVKSSYRYDVINNTKSVRVILGTSLHVLCKEYIHRNIFQEHTMSTKYIDLYSGSTFLQTYITFLPYQKKL